MNYDRDNRLFFLCVENNPSFSQSLSLPLYVPALVWFTHSPTLSLSVYIPALVSFPALCCRIGMDAVRGGGTEDRVGGSAQTGNPWCDGLSTTTKWTGRRRQRWRWLVIIREIYTIILFPSRNKDKFCGIWKFNVCMKLKNESEILILLNYLVQKHIWWTNMSFMCHKRYFSIK